MRIMRISGGAGKRLGIFGFDFELPPIPPMPPPPGLPLGPEDLALPPAPPAPPAPPPAAPPAEPPPIELPPVVEPEYLFPTTVAPLACPLPDGSFRLLDPVTFAVIADRVVTLPPGAVVATAGDARCGRVPVAVVAPAAAAVPAAPGGISTETALIGAGVAIGVIALVAILG